MLWSQYTVSIVHLETTLPSSMSLCGLLLLIMACGVNKVTSNNTTTLTIPNNGTNSTTQQTRTLEDYFCTDLSNEISSFTIIELSSETNHLIKPGNFCVIRDLSNITIIGFGDTPAMIRCTGEDNAEFQSGFGFRNITGLSISNVVFDSCGGVISNETYNYGDEPLLIYAGELLQAVIIMNNCYDVEIESIVITQYRGYGLLGLNLLGHSKMNNITVHSSYANIIGLTSSNLTTLQHSGSGILVVYIDTVFDEREIEPNDSRSNHTLIISNTVLVNNTNIYPDTYAESLRVVEPSPLPLGGAGGLTVDILQLRFDVRIEVRDSEFSDNLGTLSGGMSLFHKNSLLHSMVDINNCIMRNNTLLLERNIGGAGLQIVFVIFQFTANVSCFSHKIEEYPEYIVSVRNTTFRENRAMEGGAVFIYSFSQNILKVRILFEDVLFKDNEATAGGDCILAQSERSIHVAPSKLFVTMKSIRAEGNGNNFEGAEYASSGAFTFKNLAAANIKGSREYPTIISNCESSAISAFDTKIYLSGSVVFQNNVALRGAAIKLQANSYLLLSERVDIRFCNNTAHYEGGAIYSDAISGDQCSIQFITEQEVFNSTNIIFQPEGLNNLDLNVTFIDNQAPSGKSLYASPIYNCSGFQDAIVQLPRNRFDDIYNTLFTFKSDNETVSFLQEFRSTPAQPCFCTSNDTITCDSRERREVFLGRSFSLGVVPVDNVKQPVRSTVQTRLQNHGNITFQDDSVITLTELRQSMCQEVKYTLKYEENRTAQLELSLSSAGITIVADITVLPCPIGFEFNNRSGVCDCINVYKEMGFTCNIESGLVERLNNEWVGLVHYSRFEEAALSSICPSGYCEEKEDLRRINITDPEGICFGNRTGELCGKCEEGLSMMFGTNICGMCSNFYLFTIVLYALAGLLLVCLLFLLKITISTGTINGLIFYAQIIGVNMSLLIDRGETRIFTIFISLLNLDLGFPLCFYDGMDKAAEVGLQFVFPAYIWLIVIGIIIATNYSRNLQKVFGNNICVNVLVTLLYLSYAKVVRTITVIFFPAFLSTNDSSGYSVWFFDGTVIYFTGFHILLSIASIVMIAIFVVPYQLVLLMSPWCLKSSKLSYYLKPVIDANVAPFKDKMRYWFGFRLIFVEIQIIFSIILSSNYFTLVLFLHFVMDLLLTVAQALLKPFKTTSLNLLDLFFLVNINLYIGTRLYLYTSNDYLTRELRIPLSQAAEGLFVGSAMIVFCGILLYHIWLVCNCNCTILQRIRDKLANKKPEIQVGTTEVVVSADDLEHSEGYVEGPISHTSSDWSHSSNRQLRESLLND